MFCIVLEDRLIVREGINGGEEADNICERMERESGKPNLMVMRTDRALKMGMRRERKYA